MCVSLGVISYNNKSSTPKLISQRSQNKKDRKKIKTLHPQPGIIPLRKIIACYCDIYIKHTCSFCERCVKITSAGIGVPCSSRYILKCQFLSSGLYLSKTYSKQRFGFEAPLQVRIPVYHFVRCKFYLAFFS